LSIGSEAGGRLRRAQLKPTLRSRLPRLGATSQTGTRSGWLELTSRVAAVPVFAVPAHNFRSRCLNPDVGSPNFLCAPGQARHGRVTVNSLRNWNMAPP